MLLVLFSFWWHLLAEAVMEGGAFRTTVDKTHVKAADICHFTGTIFSYSDSGHRISTSYIVICKLCRVCGLWNLAAFLNKGWNESRKSKAAADNIVWMVLWCSINKLAIYIWRSKWQCDVTGHMASGYIWKRIPLIDWKYFGNTSQPPRW